MVMGGWGARLGVVVFPASNLADVFSARGMGDLALEYYEEALRMYEVCERVEAMIRVYQNIGLQHHQDGNPKQALHSFERALSLALSTSNHTAAAYAHRLKGLCFFDNRMYDEVHCVGGFSLIVFASSGLRDSFPCPCWECEPSCWGAFLFFICQSVSSLEESLATHRRFLPESEMHEADQVQDFLTMARKRKEALRRYQIRKRKLARYVSHPSLE